MRVAVVGNGRTGHYVVGQLEQAGKHIQGQEAVQLAAIFDENNPVSATALADIDVAIVFVPPTAMPVVVPELVGAGVDVVCGTTGFDWPSDFAEQLTQAGSRWVIAHNFSLGMNLVRRCLQILGQSNLLFGDPEFFIEETHHIDKLDAPSGTAISWQQWLDKDCQIESTRQGDVKGIHQLNVDTQYEQIVLRHEAKDRALFAQGAVWAAINLAQANYPAGVVSFSDLVDAQLARGLGSAASAADVTSVSPTGASAQ